MNKETFMEKRYVILTEKLIPDQLLCSTIYEFYSSNFYQL